MPCSSFSCQHSHHITIWWILQSHWTQCGSNKHVGLFNISTFHYSYSLYYKYLDSYHLMNSIHKILANGKGRDINKNNEICLVPYKSVCFFCFNQYSFSRTQKMINICSVLGHTKYGKTLKNDWLWLQTKINISKNHWLSFIVGSPNCEIFVIIIIKKYWQYRVPWISHHPFPLSLACPCAGIPKRLLLMSSSLFSSKFCSS